MRFREGQRIVIIADRPVFTDNGVKFEEYRRPATFIAYNPKPWEPDECVVDYGNGRRKCTLSRIRHPSIREHISHYLPALAEALAAGRW
jgi:hypothetical protein